MELTLFVLGLRLMVVVVVMVVGAVMW